MDSAEVAEIDLKDRVPLSVNEGRSEPAASLDDRLSRIINKQKKSGRTKWITPATKIGGVFAVRHA